jgi:hypothetical protein
MTSEPAELAAGFDEQFSGGVTLSCKPIGDGKLSITVRAADGTTLESAAYGVHMFGSSQLRGQFLNTVKRALTAQSGVDAGAVREELRQWCADMHEVAQGEAADRDATELLPPEIQQILDGTQYPVEIHGGETTTWKVELDYAGYSRELEFTASEMVSAGPGALEEKIANKHYELIEIGDEDWQQIRERWQENSEVVNVVETTAADAIASRVLDKLSSAVKPVADRENMRNDPAASWYDANNGTGYDDAPASADILWVQDRFLVDQIEAAGKKLDYKPQLIKRLIDGGEVYGGNKRVKWGFARKEKFYPFNPDAVGVTEEAAGAGDEPNHSEVDV